MSSHTESDMPAHPDFHAPWSAEMAAWYTEKYGEHPCNRKTIELSGLRADDRVLDIGCGSGSALRCAAALLDEGDGVGVDLSPAMIEIARAQTRETPHGARLSFLEGEAGSLPLPDDDRTLALAINTFHHWRDIPLGLAEVARVLRPGGRLIVVEDIPSEEEREQRHAFDQQQIVDWLGRGGFQVIETGEHDTGDGEMLMVSARPR